ncbi:unnamed protein product [Acanthoscelides obtectus]|uniref:Uncharacterized protein n=1 Tax=Acanthoscelides obtectus TaxID=200917 RepID=A0A9P0PU40_ACAOB|nr:unnamed protein product [Acanthoscelides obtectus]CAK1627152.1 hypothetical protein AOBTE_LOCUS4343 [Acanthoscelides obtectus]
MLCCRISNKQSNIHNIISNSCLFHKVVHEDVQKFFIRHYTLRKSFMINAPCRIRISMSHSITECISVLSLLINYIIYN